MPVQVFSKSDNNVLPLMKVRVGYVHFPGFTDVDANGVRSGYGYDFLQKVAPYCNFEYEYMAEDKNYSEVMDMLERGEVDLLVPCHQFPPRDTQFGFTDQNIGACFSILTTHERNTQYDPNNPKTFDGMKVGFMHQNSISGGYERFVCSRYGIGFKMHEFDDWQSMLKALENGEVDAIATKELRPLMPWEVQLAKFDNNEMKVAVNKEQKEILSRLNHAILKLEQDSPDWRNVLYQDNFQKKIESDNSFNLSLSAEEEAYLDTLSIGEPLKVLFNPDRAPYASYKDGKIQGFLYDLFVLIANNLGLHYEIIPIKTTTEYNQMMINQEADLIFDSPLSVFVAESRGYYVTQPYFDGSFAMVHRKADSSPYYKTVAAKEGALNVTALYQSMYGDKKIIEYPSLDDCVQAVKDGEADCCYMYLYAASGYVSEDYSSSIDYSPVQGTSTKFRIAVKKGQNPVLFSMMNKYASKVDINTMQTLIAGHRIPSETSLKAYIYRNPIKFILAFVVLGILVLVTIASNREKKKERIQNLKLKKAYDEANKANQAKSQFLANMSHDIRTPMNAILGMTHIAQKSDEDIPRVKDCLSKIEVSSQHLLSLINDVLDMSKMEAGNMVFVEDPVDMAELLDECYTMIAPMAKEMDVEITHHEDMKPKNRYVLSSPLHLRQIMINIASNAVKYNKKGGKLDLQSTERMLDDDTVEYTFSFADTGIGMSKEFIKRVFDPFSQESAGSRTTYKGTGLGLSIVKMLVENMGGTISVTSEKGVGSTFVIVMPFKLDKNKNQSQNAKQDDVEPGLKGMKILLVEDNELNMEIAQFMLEDMGASVDTAENGQIAVDMVSQGSVKYDLVIMDLMMPVMDGYEATKAIRNLQDKNLANIPIIAMSANAFEEDRKKVLDAGMNGFVAKPVDTDLLIAAINKVK